MYKHKYLKYKNKYITLKMNQRGGGVKKIYIVRHGETDWNIQKKQQGCEANIEINENGRHQALITGKYLNDYQQKESRFDIIYSSSQIRAIETAKIIAKELGYNNEIKIIDDLKEICVGKLSGTTDQERKTDPQFTKLHQLQSKYVNIIDPIDKMKNLIFYEEKISKNYGRESLEELFQRINRVLKQIINDDNNKILIVTHSALIKNIFMLIGNTYDYKDGDITNGTNCKLGYIEYNNSLFKIITNPNTIHFNLYK